MQGDAKKVDVFSNECVKKCKGRNRWRAEKICTLTWIQALENTDKRDSIKLKKSLRTLTYKMAFLSSAAASYFE